MDRLLQIRKATMEAMGCTVKVDNRGPRPCYTIVNTNGAPCSLIKITEEAAWKAIYLELDPTRNMELAVSLMKEMKIPGRDVSLRFMGDGWAVDTMTPGGELVEVEDETPQVAICLGYLSWLEALDGD